MAISIKINRDQLRAALCTAAKSDVRYYITGVCIEATPPHTRLIATDGACMSVQVSQEDNQLTDSSSQHIIPSDIVKLVTAKSPVFLELTSENGDLWQIHLGGTYTTFKMIDGKFPDWRRVVQTKVSNEVGDYDIDILAQFSKAAKILGCKYPGRAVNVGQNGKSAGRVTITDHPDYLGVIMPKLSADPTTKLVYREMAVNPLLES